MHLLESIKVQDGVFHNLNYHNQRMQQARRALFGIAAPLSLEDLLHIPPAYRQGLVKCRVLYQEAIQQVSFTVYQPRKIQTLQMVYDNTIDYTYKYADREPLEQLYAQKGNADDILIVRNGAITDTMYGNIAFFDNKHHQWYTPLHPLLRGTQRQKLLDQQAIVSQHIIVEDLIRFSMFKVFNAMNEFHELPAVNITGILR